MSDLAPELVTWSHTAAALAQMDLVVTADCSVANLAGAMGLPVWICLRAAAEWRWLLDRTDSPWYPTARLYRQSKLGDWSLVFAEVAGDLAALLAERSASIASHSA